MIYKKGILTMKKEILLNGRKICYELQYKKVKNINLRIKTDGSVYVSANRYVPQAVIEQFLITKAEFIITAIDKYEGIKNTVQKQFYTEDELLSVIVKLCEKAYPYYEKLGIKYPEIKVKYMSSCWGRCHVQKCVLTFSTNLMFAPYECIEYVVWHEFTHFLQANHSAKFYEELEKVCPHWKEWRKKLKEIPIK